jgi:hypothetical protein
MYLVEWMDNGELKSIVADAWITELSIVSDLKEQGFNPISRPVEDVLAERV